MKVLEYLGGIFVAILTFPMILIGGVWSFFDLPRYFRIKSK